MKKSLIILTMCIVLAACNNNTDNTPTQSIQTTNEHTTSNHIKTKDFSLTLPQNFSIIENHEGYDIVKTDTNDTYFHISLFTKADQELITKCKNIGLVESAEELENMSYQALQEYESCQWPQTRIKIEDLNIIHTTNDGEFWIIEWGHDFPVSEESADTYAQTLQAFNVTENITDSDGNTNLVPQQLVRYFQTNISFTIQ